MIKMEKINLDLRPTTRPDLLFRELKDGGVVYEYRTDTLHSLNATAAYIWTLCDGNHTLTAIIASIQDNFKQFDTEPTSEVIQIVEKFRTLNLLANV